MKSQQNRIELVTRPGQKELHDDEEGEDGLKDITERLEAISVQQTSSQSYQNSQAYQAAQKTPTATERMKKRASSNLKDSLERVEVSLSQWFTIDTYRLLRGDEYVRQVLVENECTLENVLAGANTNSQVFTSIFAFRRKAISNLLEINLKDTIFISNDVC